MRRLTTVLLMAVLAAAACNVHSPFDDAAAGDVVASPLTDGGGGVAEGGTSAAGPDGKATLSMTFRWADDGPARSVTGADGVQIRVGEGTFRNFFQMILVDALTPDQVWEFDEEECGPEGPRPRLEVGFLHGHAYGILVLMGHNANDGKPPTLLSSGYAMKTLEAGENKLEMPLTPIVVGAAFTHYDAPSDVRQPGRLARTVGLDAGKAYKLVYTLGSATRYAGDRYEDALREVTGDGVAPLREADKAAYHGIDNWTQEDGLRLVENFAVYAPGGGGSAPQLSDWYDTHGGHSTNGVATYTVEAGQAPAVGSVYFNMVYAPFGLGSLANWKDRGKFSHTIDTDDEEKLPRWVIRNGLNDKPQNELTDFAAWTGDAGTVNVDFIGYHSAPPATAAAGEAYVNTGDGKLYRWDGGVWVVIDWTTFANPNGALRVGVVDPAAEKLNGVYEDNNPWPIAGTEGLTAEEIDDWIAAMLSVLQSGQGRYGVYTRYPPDPLDPPDPPDPSDPPDPPDPPAGSVLTLVPVAGGALTATVDGAPLTSPAEVAAGKTVVFTVTPASGAGKDGSYTLTKTVGGAAGISVTPFAGASSYYLYETTSGVVPIDTSAYSQSSVVERSLARLNSGGGGVWTFTMPDYDTTVTAAFTTVSLAGRSFEIRLDGNEPLGPQTLGGGSLPNIKGGTGSPVSITVKPRSGTAQRTLFLNAQGSLFNLADGANVALSVDTVILQGIAASGHVVQMTGSPLPAIAVNTYYQQDNNQTLVFVGAGNVFEMLGSAELMGNYNTANGGATQVVGGIFRMTGADASVHHNYSGNLGGALYASGALSAFEMSGKNAAVSTNDAYQNGGGVYVDSGASFTMSGEKTSVSYNKISYDGNDRYSAYGGGVYVGGGARFTMEGKEAIVSYNASAGANGGGVYMSGAGSVFEMRGELTKITYNEAAVSGGGVCVTNSASFTMSGEEASVSYNTVGTSGAGVFMDNGASFTMSGERASVSYNRATLQTPGYNSSNHGGGVYVWSNTEFVMSGDYAKIDHNNAVFGGGVFVSNGGSFTMSGAHAVISDNTATGATNKNENGGGGVCVSSLGTFTMSSGMILDNDASRGKNTWIDTSYYAASGTRTAIWPASTKAYEGESPVRTAPITGTPGAAAVDIGDRDDNFWAER